MALSAVHVLVGALGEQLDRLGLKVATPQAELGIGLHVRVKSHASEKEHGCGDDQGQRRHSLV